MIQPLSPADLKEVAAIHKAVMPGMLKLFDLRTIEKFYLLAIRNPMNFGYGCREEDRLIGFVMGTFDAGGFYKSAFSKAPCFFAFKALAMLVRKPRLADTFVRNFFKRPKAAMEGSPIQGMYIAVTPEARKKGVGLDLDTRLREHMKSRGVREFDIVVEDANERALSLYLKIGYVLKKTYIESGYVRRIYTYSFDREAGAGQNGPSA